MPEQRLAIEEEILRKPPGGHLIGEIERRAPKLGKYTPDEFRNFITTWTTEATQELNPEVRGANVGLINTVESLYRYVQASRYESHNPTNKWKMPNKMHAARAAHNSMFTADALHNHPELLDTFWNKIHYPLSVSAGLPPQEAENWRNGTMAELALGKALDHLFTTFKRGDLKVFKGTVEEDVKKGLDLVIQSANNKEWGFQCKLQKSNETFVRFISGEPPIFELNYRKEVNKLFDPNTGTPTNQLITELGAILPSDFRKKFNVN